MSSARRSLAIGALIWLGLPGVGRAQVGTGWTEFFPGKTIQLRGAGARYDNTGGIETFRTAPGDERAEARVFDDHRSGKWQFEGWVSIKPGIDGGCVHQVFKFLMIVGYSNDGGELRQHSQQRLGATGIFGQWVRVNTIHDADAGRAEVYINGTLRGTVDSKSPGPNGWYHKYGIYNSSGTNPEVRWRDVKFFHGPGTVPPPPVDGGAVARDAGAPDLPAPADAADKDPTAGAVDAGGGDAGGSSFVDSAGRTPRLPADASPGSSPEDPADPEPGPRVPPRSGGGCGLGGAPPEGLAGPALAVALLLAAAGRRRRRSGHEEATLPGD